MKSTFCPLPWLHALVEPNGATKLCCISSYARFNDGQLRTVYQEPLSEIFNGDYFRKVRERMLSGQRVRECSGCNKAEQSGVQSRRQRIIEQWEEGVYGPAPTSFEAFEQKTRDADFAVEPNWSYLHLNFGNLCNLRCRMCSPADSSQNARDPVMQKWYPDSSRSSPARWDGDRLSLVPIQGSGVELRGWSHPQAVSGRQFHLAARNAQIRVRALNACVNEVQMVLWNMSDRVLRVRLKFDQLPPQQLHLSPGRFEVEIPLPGLQSQPELAVHIDWSMQDNRPPAVLRREPSTRDGRVLEFGPLALESMQVVRAPSDMTNGRSHAALTRLGDHAWFVEGTAAFDELLACPEAIRRVNINGGEPLINPNAMAFIDRLIESGHAHHIQLTFNTNATKVSPDVLQRFAPFREVLLLLSIDATGSLNEYIRYPARWSRIQQNIDTLLDHGNIGIRITPTVQLYNLVGLVDLLEWCDRRELDWTIHNYLESPRCLSADIAPTALRATAIEQLRSYIASEPRLPHARTEVEQLIQRLRQPPSAHPHTHLRIFDAFTRSLDDGRKQSLADVAPDLAAAVADALADAPKPTAPVPQTVA